MKVPFVDGSTRGILPSLPYRSNEKTTLIVDNCGSDFSSVKKFVDLREKNKAALQSEIDTDTSEQT